VLQSLTFWLVDLNRTDRLGNTIIEIGRFPVTFYHGWVRYVLTTVIPVAFLTTFPAQALLGRLDIWLAGVAVAVAVLSLGAGVAAWKVALRSFTSASS
jgi:ABC-2 type transport system permease protein